MRNLFCALFIMFSFVGLSGQFSKDCTTIQDEVYTYKNQSDEAKVCFAVVVCEDAVQFYISQTSVRTFRKLEGSIWIDHKEKVVRRVVLKNGFTAFMSGKDIFMYKSNPEL